MLEVKFFRDEKNVYFNNPNGITIKKSIEDFERWIAGEGGSGGGGVSSVNGQTGAVVLDAADVGAAQAMEEITVATDGAVTQTLEANKIYHFTSTALTSLTITPAETSDIAQYHFDFISPSTAVTLTLPSTVVMPANFSVDADTRYEIDILNGYGVAQNWAVSANG